MIPSEWTSIRYGTSSDHKQVVIFSSRLCGMDTVPDPVNTLDTPPKFFYRPPGRDEYLNIADALDELFNRLDKLEETLCDNTHHKNNPEP